MLYNKGYYLTHTAFRLSRIYLKRSNGVCGGLWLSVIAGGLDLYPFCLL